MLSTNVKLFLYFKFTKLSNKQNNEKTLTSFSFITNWFNFCCNSIQLCSPKIPFHQLVLKEKDIAIDWNNILFFLLIYFFQLFVICKIKKTFIYIHAVPIHYNNTTMLQYWHFDKLFGYGRIWGCILSHFIINTSWGWH